MAMVVTWDGGILDLNSFFANDGGAWRIHLFQTSVAPTKASLPSDFVESTFGGYAAQGLNAWGSAYKNSSDIIEVDGADVAWTPSSSSGLPQLVYGYYVENGTGDLLWAERFAAPFTFNSTADTLTVTPQMLLDDI